MIFLRNRAELIVMKAIRLISFSTVQIVKDHFFVNWNNHFEAIKIKTPP